MISAKDLSDGQKQAMAEWVGQGASIADLQRRLKDEFGFGVTYMEMRFLVLDLGLQIKQPVKERAAKPQPAPANDQAQAAAGKLSVTLDELALPGALVSGKVRFSDGQSGVWMLDQYGRPGLDPDTAGYRPSAEDLAEFQRQLSGLLRTREF